MPTPSEPERRAALLATFEEFKRDGSAPWMRFVDAVIAYAQPDSPAPTGVAAAEAKAGEYLSTIQSLHLHLADSNEALAAQKAKGDALANEVEEEVEFMEQQRLFGCADRLQAALVAYRDEPVKELPVNPAMCSKCGIERKLIAWGGWSHTEKNGWSCPQCSTEPAAWTPGKRFGCSTCKQASNYPSWSDAEKAGWKATDESVSCPRCSTPPAPPSPAKDEWTVRPADTAIPKVEVWKNGKVVAVFFEGESDARRFAASAEMEALLEQICDRFTENDRVVISQYSKFADIIKTTLAKVKEETP